MVLYGNLYIASPTPTVDGGIALNNNFKYINDTLNTKANTSALGNYLPLAGGTMAGSIDMGIGNYLTLAGGAISLGTASGTGFSVDSAGNTTAFSFSTSLTPGTGSNSIFINGDGSASFANGIAGIDVIGNLYGANFPQDLSGYLPLSGGSMIGVINDSSNAVSIDPVNRWLYASNGTPIIIDYSGTQNGAATITFNQTGGNYCPIFNYPIQDSCDITSVNTNSRQLIADNGSTVAIDWSMSSSNGGNILFNGYPYIVDNAGNINVNSVNGPYQAGVDTSGNIRGISLQTTDSQTLAAGFIVGPATLATTTNYINTDDGSVSFAGGLFSIDAAGNIAATNFPSALDNYLPLSGANALTGSLDMGSNSINNVSIISDYASGLQSVDINSRVLYANDPSGKQMIDWTGTHAGIAVIDFNIATNAICSLWAFADSYGQTSLDTQTRQLTSATNTLLMNWSGMPTPGANISFYNGSVMIDANIVDHTLFNASIDANARQLTDTTGNNIMINWTGIPNPAAALSFSGLTAVLPIQLAPPATAIGGIYFDGSHFYGCLDGSNWTQII